MKQFDVNAQIESGIKTEVSVKKKQEVEYVLEGTLRPDGGHKVWEINKLTSEVKEAEYRKNTVEFNGFKHIEREELYVKADCVYIPSLNAKNAKKKYDKNPSQSHYYVKPPPMKLEDIFNPNIEY